MPYYQDLDSVSDDTLRAVGWLDAKETYTQGDVPEPFVAKLAELLVNPWQPAVTAGFHPCPFCRFTKPGAAVYKGHEIVMGATDVYVPGDGEVFIAPSLIFHYIDAHQYAPPRKFQVAVKECPPMRSTKYFKALLMNGPKGLVKTAGNRR